MKRPEEMSEAELEAAIEKLSGSELDQLASTGRFPRKRKMQLPKLHLPELQLPQVGTSECFLFGTMAVTGAFTLYSLALLLSGLWLPLTVDKPAYDLAAQRSRAGIPTRVYYCTDSDFGGRTCTLRNNHGVVEKVVIRPDH